MTRFDQEEPTGLRELKDLLSADNLTAVPGLLGELSTIEITEVLERLSDKRRAVVYRLLPKELALEVFEALDPSLQGDLIRSLRDGEVAAIFADLDPDDRVWLLDELPASLAPRLLRGLSESERQLTNAVLGYPLNSIGRRMSPEYVSIRADQTAGQGLARVRSRLGTETEVYLLPVVDSQRRLLGVARLRDLLSAADDAPLHSIMVETKGVRATAEAEYAARQALETGALALPVVDSEERLLGILTIDDAARILEIAESEDAARQGGAEPLRRPYFATTVREIVRSRVVWLLVLAVGATLTVQVLEVFEGTLAEVTMLALFVPLIIGTGGNTGNQAATTVTRALAMQDVRVRDVWAVLGRELQVGSSLGLLLGTVALGAGTLIYDWHIGLILGLTLLSVCTMAASVGGVMPLIAKRIKVDPAVFSNPFITTFVDAAGLVIYFLIARAVLGF